jgi:hypothetical protein
MSKDAIIVLGAGISADGQIPLQSKARADLAIKLAGPYRTPIVFSGRWSLLLSYVPIRSEAEAMAEYVLTRVQKTYPLYMEKSSLDTIGNAYFSALHYLERKSWKNIVVVTSDFQLERATFVFKKVLGPSYSVDVMAAPSGLNQQELRLKAMTEKKLLDFTKELLGNVKDGTMEGIHAAMQTLEGYGDKPAHTKQSLLELIQRTDSAPDTYGLSGT